MMEFEEILQWSPIFFRTKEIYYVNLLYLDTQFLLLCKM